MEYPRKAFESIRRFSGHGANLFTINTVLSFGVTKKRGILKPEMLKNIIMIMHDVAGEDSGLRNGSYEGLCGLQRSACPRGCGRRRSVLQGVSMLLHVWVALMDDVKDLL